MQQAMVEQVDAMHQELAELKRQLALATIQVAHSPSLSLSAHSQSHSQHHCLVSDSKVTVYTHTHILTITCTCCYDVINGIQDLKICSHADSLSTPFFLSIYVSVSLCLSTSAFVSPDCLLTAVSLTAATDRRPECCRVSQ